MKRDYKLFLRDVILAMDSIEDFVAGMNFRELKDDDKTSSAVIRKFEIIEKPPTPSKISERKISRNSLE